MEGARTWPVPISAQSQHRWQERRLRPTRGRLLFSSLSRAGSQPRIASSYKHMQPGEPAEAIDETDSWQQTTSAGPPRRALPWLSVQLAAIGISTPTARAWKSKDSGIQPLHTPVRSIECLTRRSHDPFHIGITLPLTRDVAWVWFRSPWSFPTRARVSFSCDARIAIYVTRMPKPAVELRRRRALPPGRATRSLQDQHENAVTARVSETGIDIPEVMNNWAETGEG